MLRREHNITSTNLYVCMSVCVYNDGNQGFITETHPLLYYIVVTVCTVFSISKVLYMLSYSYTTDSSLGIYHGKPPDPEGTT